MIIRIMRDMPLPKYHQIYLVLKEQLEEGVFRDGLPGELTLMEQFKVARVTIRKSLQRLQSDGLILRESGRRTRAVGSAEAMGRASQESAGELGGMFRSLVDASLATSLQVLRAETLTATSAVANALQLEPNELVHKVVRLRSTKEGPLSHITTYGPASIVPRFSRRELATKPMLVLLEEAGVRIGEGQQTITARLADTMLAEHLGVAVGSALLAVRRLVFDHQGKPVQWLHGFYRPDRYAYEMKLSSAGSADTHIWLNEEHSSN
jgi:GntR family transcriptional regulator